MYTRLCCVLALALLVATPSLTQTLRFEAEDIVVTQGAWQENKSSETLWNLWSTDNDAQRKWSEGVVLQSPRVLRDRERPADGAPVLHAVVTGIPPGTWSVTYATVGRPVAISFDGQNWRKLTTPQLGEFRIDDGRFEIWVDDRYASETNSGSCYFDYLEFAPAAASVLGVQNGDFEFVGRAGADITGWTWWTREQNAGTARQVAEGAHGGERCVLIEHNGARDFALSNRGRLDVQEGQRYTVSAWMRCEDTTAVEIAVVALAGGQTVNWNIASDGVQGTSEWKHVLAPLRIPKGVDQIYVRVVGHGRVRAWVDDVALSEGWEQVQRVEKPPVQGWASSRVTEKLDRGLVAVPLPGNRIYVSWRLLAEDPADVAFNLYRSAAGGAPMRLNERPLTTTCDFVDDSPTPQVPNTYTVRAVVNGVEGEPSTAAVATPSQEGRPCLTIPLQGEYNVQRVGIADLNGDGRYDFVIKQPNKNVDPGEGYWQRSEDTYKVEAYLSDGTFLWRRDLGWSIEQGIWYSPMIVYDLDGDGRAEVCLKTGPEEDLRDAEGKVQTGPEWLSIWDGMTGEEITRTDWPSREGFESYNLASRNQMCVAYLDGKTPCLIVERGTYRTIKVVAYQYRDRQLQELWRWNDREEPGGLYRGQGAHSMHAVDVDGDGRDEVFLGSAVLDDNGVGLWSTGRGHPDHHYVGDIDPTRPGLEVYYGIEPPQREGGCLLVDAATGEEIWALQEPTQHVHATGMCADIDPSHPGLECYSGERDFPEKKWLWAASGELIATTDIGGLSPRTVYWDADPQREMLRGRVYKWQGATLTEGISGNVILVADILGDWREEIITSAPGELRIYSTTIPATDRRVCLMQDPLYRLDVAIAAMGYTQWPMTSYCLSAGQAAMSVRPEQARLEPGKAADLLVALVAPAHQALSGTITLHPDAGLGLGQERLQVEVPAGEVGRYRVPLVLTQRLNLLGGDAARGIRAVFEGGGVHLEAATEVAAFDLPSDLPRVQAEDFSAQGGGQVQVREDKVGHDGRSISHWDNQGHWLEWKLTAPADGRYYLVLRYCSQFDNLRAATLDGAPVGSGSFRFPATGGFSAETNDWRHWALRDASGPLALPLKAGEHILRLENRDGKGMNLDYLMLVPA